MIGTPPRLLSIMVILGLTAPARGTWSVVLVDSSTREVAIGTVTCLTDFDLLAILPVVVVGRGAAACQAAGDFDGLRRPILFDALENGTDPQQMLALVSGISGHPFRQYGIADTLGRTLTFAGTDVEAILQWAGGSTNTVGSLHYAIQGNVLAGSCVLTAMEQAVLNTPGDIPAKLIAAMEAARATGGDGRCSCNVNNADTCGCPPPGFTKSGHVGGMIVARIGDTDDPVCNAAGCADGDYFMRLNVAGQSTGSPDPVIQLQGQFDTWRSTLVGRPDAVSSNVSFSDVVDGVVTMTITLFDWQQLAVTQPIQSVTVEHAADSDGLATIGSAVDQGNGIFTVELNTDTLGTDRFVVTVDDDIRPVVLMPEPDITYEDLGIPATAGWGLGALIGALLAAGTALVVLRRRIGNPANESS